ncbi:hypothetical protein HU200_055979 [Digitaria exilis]|uniref:Carboxypeptidase n=1 Tax=Digitaria exilis TaxID=1010633 RepID=A0A835AHB1_9POAL|nr:hypothetical protein HU200_055979 [Digitaria exilis]CAB3480148.1 unnamed protein product [Digitaria exilis]
MAPPLRIVVIVFIAVAVLLSLFSIFETSFPFSLHAKVFPKQALPTRSGYLPIPPTNASLFFVFHEATDPITPPSSTPLLLWLQGGPGCSGLVGNFFELGPFFVNPDGASLSRNPFSWNRRFGLLFVDSPLGTGFSAAASPADIPTGQPVIASHILSALQSFLSLDRSFRSRPLFLAGESYAGKYIPVAASHILDVNPTLPEHRRVNLVGVAIGNGFTHPVVQVATHADRAYSAGLINTRKRAELAALQAEAVSLTMAERWVEAAAAKERVLLALETMTGLATLYDVARQRPYQTAPVAVFVNRPEVKAALGVRRDGARWVMCSGAVRAAMESDVMKSALPEMETILMRRRGTRVLLYQGVRDLMDTVAATEAWMGELRWGGLRAFLDAERVLPGGDLAGYVQWSGMLTHVVVHGTGHMVPEMIERWVLEAVLPRRSRGGNGGTRRAGPPL